MDSRAAWQSDTNSSSTCYGRNHALMEVIAFWAIISFCGRMVHMKIQRIDTYDDPRFTKEALYQHGCYLVDNEPYEIMIVSKNEAVICGKDRSVYCDVIDHFRLHAPHITCFYDVKHTIVKEYAAQKLFRISLSMIQPSQFYVDQDKLDAVSHFIQQEEDVIVQLGKYKDRWISTDGHTRLYEAYRKGFTYVYGMEDEINADTIYFVEEAQKRGIFVPQDMIVLGHQQYIDQWFGFCEEYFHQ